MRHEFDEVSELLQHLSDGGDLRCAVIQGLDLHDLDDASLHTVDGESVFLGCQLSDAQRQIIQARGGLVFSQPQGVPYAVHPRTLYSVDMLTAGYERGAPESISDSYDGRVYAHYCQHTKGMRKTPVVESLAQRLHDHGIDDAMADFLDNDGAPRRVVSCHGRP